MNDTSRITPPHPLLSGINLNHQAGILDALNNSVATLYLLSDLFGSDAEDYDPLETAQARRGMWLQLRGIAGLLTAIERTMDPEGRLMHQSHESRLAIALDAILNACNDAERAVDTEGSAVEDIYEGLATVRAVVSKLMEQAKND